jgi:hypothetical protein
MFMVRLPQGNPEDDKKKIRSSGLKEMISKGDLAVGWSDEGQALLNLTPDFFEHSQRFYFVETGKVQPVILKDFFHQHSFPDNRYSKAG